MDVSYSHMFHFLRYEALRVGEIPIYLKEESNGEQWCDASSAGQSRVTSTGDGDASSAGESRVTSTGDAWCDASSAGESRVTSLDIGVDTQPPLSSAGVSENDSSSQKAVSSLEQDSQPPLSSIGSLDSGLPSGSSSGIPSSDASSPPLSFPPSLGPVSSVDSSAVVTAAEGIFPTTPGLTELRQNSPRQSEINVRFNIDTAAGNGGNAKRYDHDIQHQEFITDIVVGGESNENILRVKVGGGFRPSRQSRSPDPWIKFYDNLTTRAKKGPWFPGFIGKEEDYVEVPVSIAYTNKSVQTDFLRETELTSVLRVLKTESHIDVRIYIDATVMEV